MHFFLTTQSVTNVQLSIRQFVHSEKKLADILTNSGDWCQQWGCINKNVHDSSSGPGKTLVKVRAKVLPMRLAQISKIQNPLPKRLSLYSLAKPNKRTAKNTHCADHKIPAASKIQTLQAICRSLSFAYNVVGIAMSNWRRVTVTR